MDDLILTTRVAISAGSELGQITHGVPAEGDAVLGKEQGCRIAGLASEYAPDGSGRGDR
jgi:hypothetical protein